MSSEVRAAVLLDPEGAERARSEALDAELGARLAELARELSTQADAAAERTGIAAAAVEVSTAGGTVFLVRERPRAVARDWILAAVAKRFALSSLMFMDLRHVLAQVDPGAG